ncbi:hypothetical protein [Streptomyces himalayensis]
MGKTTSSFSLSLKVWPPHLALTPYGPLASRLMVAEAVAVLPPLGRSQVV